jgi:hypothetical protein
MLDGLGCSAFARRYWRNHYCFLFLQVLRWFTSLRCLLTAYEFSGGFSGISQRGFPHSEIPGSKLICSSPGLIAAYRVLRRLLVPRHSPYTLSSLTIRNSTYAYQRWRLRDCPQPASPARVSHMHTACVWSEKTTVCRIFSCQRSAAARWAAARPVPLDPSMSSLGRRPRGLPGRRADSDVGAKTWWRIPGSNR